MYRSAVRDITSTSSLRQSTSQTDTVEDRGKHRAQANAGDQGPPAKKPKKMQTAALQHHSTPKTVGQRLKDTLQTNKGQQCRSPVSDAALSPNAVSTRFGSMQINTIRVIGQYLKNLGLQETVAALVGESGCTLEDSLAIRLREYVLNGEWDHALSIVDKLAPYASRKSLLRIRERLFEEKFASLLLQEKVLDALYLLTVDFPSDECYFDRRNHLAGLLYVDPKTADLCMKTGAHCTWQERNQLMDAFQDLLPNSIMLPSNRLETLLSQSWRIQCRECFLHIKEDLAPSPEYILADHQCDWDKFPIFASQAGLFVLTKHVDEVWNVVYSPCGSYLATGGRSGPAYVWKVLNSRKLELFKTLGDGRAGSAMIAWTYDSDLLAVCAADAHSTDIVIYEVKTGSVHCTINNKGTDSTVFSFIPGKFPYRMVCADQAGHFCEYLIRPKVARQNGKFEGYRIRALHCLRNGSVIAADTHNRVRAYRFSDDSEVTLIEEVSQIVTFVVDFTEKYILIDTKQNGLRLWNLLSRTLIRSFTDAPHEDFIIYSCFGGPSQLYIATGSTEDKIYIWRYDSEQVIVKLGGHAARVNAVAWHPHLPQLVSCSDDCTVRVWGSVSDYNIRRIE